MKRSAKSFAKISNLCESVHQQLNMYVLAAVLALVSVLALTQPSEAKIVYTSADVVLSCPHSGCGHEYNLDLNHDGVTDFTIIVESISEYHCSGRVWAIEGPASGNGAIDSSGDAAALMQGAPIGHNQQFLGSTAYMAFSDVFDCGGFHGGPWYDVTDRYLGLSFQRNGRTHYGWARLSVLFKGVFGIRAALTGYAYETIAGKSIKAGQRKEAADDPTNEDLGPDASLTNPIPEIPQTTSLGMLALGTQSVPLWRRKESALEADLKGAL